MLQHGYVSEVHTIKTRDECERNEYDRKYGKGFHDFVHPMILQAKYHINPTFNFL